MFSQLVITTFTALGLCSIVRSHPYRRQLDIVDGLVEGTLGALAGAIGIEATYDYVIIGGGTAGNAIGTRLAEAGFGVAIIEAGEFYEIGDPVLASTPAGDIAFIGTDISDSDPLIDWEFVAKNQAGTNGRELHYARGKCLGGSSALNFMIYQRGTNESYQMWADLVNDTSYTFDNFIPYFKKSVAFNEPNMEKRFANSTPGYRPSAFQTGAGPLEVSYTNYASPFSTWMEQGLHAIGIDAIEDFNSGSLLGSQWCSATIRPSDESRSSSEASFIQSATDAGLSSLKIYTGTMAQKILFNDNKTATGVKVESLGITYTIHATQEVIVSAGAFHSPQMLMVSGVGPSATLENFGIPVLSDLPGVGQDMWDHITFGPSYRVNVDTFTRLPNDLVYLAESLIEYETNQSGPLCNSADFLGWEKVPSDLRANFTSTTRSELSYFPGDWPEVEYIAGNGFVGNFTNLLTTQPSDGYQYGTILAALIAPTSRGNVTIRSNSVSDLPVINPNWLTTESDEQVVVAAYRRARAAFHSNAMSPVVIGEEYFPGTEYETDEQILNVIKSSFQTLWHAACTCKMGNSTDKMAVVDSQARVFGVHGVRVVDASAFPVLVPGHPQSTIYALAEKIADMIINGGTASI